MISAEKVVPVQSADFYNALAPGYADISASRLPYLDGIDELVVSKARAIKPLSYMDIGCGDGRRTSKIAAALGIKHPVGVDESSEMLIRSELKDTEQASVTELALGKKFDVISALWNVMGHVQSGQRTNALAAISQHLVPGGLCLLDVNNRYNAKAYGAAIVEANQATDARGEASGDVTAYHSVNGTTYATLGHVFHPSELDELVTEVPNLKITDKLFVDYANGSVVTNSSEGQIFYEITRV